MATLEVPASVGWETYAAGTALPHFAWWAAENCVQSIDVHAGRPLVLEEWQREFMAEVLAVDDHDDPYWRTVVLVVPRGNGKTTLLAAYGTYHLVDSQSSPEVLLAASSDKQAGRLFDAVVAFIRLSPVLRQAVHVREHVGQIARADGFGKIHRMASHANAAHGYSPSRVIIDELHAWGTDGLRGFWDAMVTAGGKRRDHQAMVITTAGEAHTRDDGILGQLIDRNEQAGEVEHRGPALTISRNHRARVLVYNYSAPVDRSVAPRAQRQDRAAVRAANPASWVSDAYLAEQAASPNLSDGAFLQLHACVWATGVNALVDPGQWRDLAGGAPIPAGEGVCVMVDGSQRYDTTAVAWARQAGDGRVDVEARVFSARPEVAHHVLHHGGEIDFQAVEDFIVALAARYQVREIAYDPWLMGRTAQLLDERLPAVGIFPVPQGSVPWMEAVATFRRLVADGTVRHTGDPVVASHVAAAVARDTPKGPIPDKRLSRKPIDALVACVGAVWRAVQRPSVVNPYARSEKDLLVL